MTMCVCMFVCVWQAPVGLGLFRVEGVGLGIWRGGVQRPYLWRQCLYEGSEGSRGGERGGRGRSRLEGEGVEAVPVSGLCFDLLHFLKSVAVSSEQDMDPNTWRGGGGGDTPSPTPARRAGARIEPQSPAAAAPLHSLCAAPCPALPLVHSLCAAPCPALPLECQVEHSLLAGSWRRCVTAVP